MATSIDFSKGIDFSPLEKLGVDKAGGIKLLAGMAGLIDLEFKAKIKGVFNQEELKIIGEEAAKKGIKPEEGMEFLEEKYQAKTGVYFLEELRRLYNRYIVILADLLKQVRSDAAKVNQADKAKQEELDRLIKEKNWPEAIKILEEVLKK
ncbi:hypothetical protein L6272_00655 [Microgenomates group bacterium]|nr:hypothetical protein [Microgenomates group bacterium]